MVTNCLRPIALLLTVLLCSFTQEEPPKSEPTPETGRVFGCVRAFSRSSYEVPPSATVELVTDDADPKKRKLVKATLSDEEKDGAYEFKKVAPGKYFVRCEALGYKEYPQDHPITVKAGDNELDCWLNKQPESTGAVVDVSYESFARAMTFVAEADSRRHSVGEVTEAEEEKLRHLAAQKYELAWSDLDLYGFSPLDRAQIARDLRDVGGAVETHPKAVGVYNDVQDRGALTKFVGDIDSVVHGVDVRVDFASAEKVGVGDPILTDSLTWALSAEDKDAQREGIDRLRGLWKDKGEVLDEVEARLGGIARAAGRVPTVPAALAKDPMLSKKAASLLSPEQIAATDERKTPDEKP